MTGSADPFGSHDLEDILALLASRPSIVADMESAPDQIRDFVGGRFSRLLGTSDPG